MKQQNTGLTTNKKQILEDIKKTYRIKPITVIIVLLISYIILGTIFHSLGEFGNKLTSDFVGALINLFYAWNLGLGLYQGIWRFINSRKINKVLFPKIEQLINESEDKTYNETEKEVDELVKMAYEKYTEKYNKLTKIYWTSLKVSLIFPLAALAISLIYHF